VINVGNELPRSGAILYQNHFQAYHISSWPVPELSRRTTWSFQRVRSELCYSTLGRGYVPRSPLLSSFAAQENGDSGRFWKLVGAGF
jgi:hypothetical protein